MQTSENTLKKNALRWVVLLGTAVLCLKFFAFYLTQSSAILADALESVVNVLAGCFALFSLKLASRPKDEGHPYGHGKIEFLSAGFEGSLILIAGIVIITKGILAFIHHDLVAKADTGAILSAISGTANFFMGRFLVRKGKEYNSAILIADGKHLITDTFSSIGLVISLIIIYFTHLIWVDYLITVIFGAMIFFTGIQLIRDAVSNLLDKADYEKLQQIIDIFNTHRQEKWIDIHNLRVLKYGAKIHVDCHVTLPWYDSLEVSHNQIRELENLAKENSKQEIEFFIHADPCLPISCPICLVHNCPERKSPFVQKLNWSIENVLPDQKHSLQQNQKSS